MFNVSCNICNCRANFLTCKW